MNLHIIGGGIAGSISTFSLQHKVDHIFLYEKEEKFFQFATSKNGAILRTYEHDPYVSLLAKRSALLFFQLLKSIPNLIDLLGLVILPTNYDPLEYETPLPEWHSLLSLEEKTLQLLFNESKRNPKENENFITGLYSKAYNFTGDNNFYMNLQKNIIHQGRFIKSNGVLNLDLFLEFIQNSLQKLINQKKLTVLKNNELTSWEKQKDKESLYIKKLIFKDNNLNKFIVTPLEKEDIVVNAMGSWATHFCNLCNEQSLPWCPPLRSYKRNLYYFEKENIVPSLNHVLWNENQDFYIKSEEKELLVSDCQETPTICSDYKVNVKDVDRMYSSLNHVLPWLHKKQHKRVHACLRTFTLDDRPILGFDPYLDNLFWVSGLGGRGMSISLGLIPLLQKYWEQKDNKDISVFTHPFSCHRFI